MDFSDESKLPNNVDDDSGVDNASDSSRDYTSSDYEEYFNSDNESSTLSKKNYSNQSLTSIDNQLTNDNVNPKEFQKERVCSIDKSLLRTYLSSTIEKSVNEDVVRFYEILIDGQFETVDFGINSGSGKPVWLNEEKFKKGQKFARDHLFCINFAEMVSLYILFAQNSTLGPLIFTGKSDSPFKAFKRYMNTLTKLISWYTDDVWNEYESEGRKNLDVVRNMHKSVYRKLTKCPADLLKKKTTLTQPNSTLLWCPLRDVIMSDFRDSIPPSRYNEVEKKLCRKVWINQMDMSITQFGFVGLAVTYPQAFGIHLASEDDLDAFVHMWRGLGFLLGVKDECNFCNGDLKSVRERTIFFLDFIAKPAFRNVTVDWEHMCRCLTAGIAFYIPRVDFEPSLLYLCNTLSIEMPRLRTKMSFVNYLVYLVHKLIFYLMQFQNVLWYFNSRLYYIIDKTKKAPPEVLEKWENKIFDYMKQTERIQTEGQIDEN